MVCLTIASGVVMLMASSANNTERQVVEQRHQFDQPTEEVELDIWSLSDLVRDYVIAKDPEVPSVYHQREVTLKAVEHRLSKFKGLGTMDEELTLLYEGLQIVDVLQDEQAAALASVTHVEKLQAIVLLCRKNYEQELERAQDRINHFYRLLGNRVCNTIEDTTQSSRILRTTSEVMVGSTALLFLPVLGSILKHRVLYPAVRLNDVVNCLASQDYAVETFSFNQIDKIGDMAQAIRMLRKNGLVRQRLEKEQNAGWAIRDPLARITQRPQGCESLTDVIDVAELFALNIAPGIAGRLYILDQEPWQIHCVAQQLSPQGKTDASHPGECWAIRHGQSRPPVQGEPDIACYHLLESCQHHTLRVPLIAQGEATGLLSLQNPSDDSAPFRAYLELTTGAFGLALVNQRLCDALLEKALYDPLTEPCNRHHLEGTLRTQMSQAVRNKEPTNRLMIDIDHFRGINDHFGHGAGGNVIKSIAATIQRAVHDSGMAFRYGGEEFLVLLANTDEQATNCFATEIYNGVRELSLRFGVSDIGHVGVSIDVASYPQHAQSDNLSHAAGVALYRVKELGRSRVVSFSMLEVS